MSNDDTFKQLAGLADGLVKGRVSRREFIGRAMALGLSAAAAASLAGSAVMAAGPKKGGRLRVGLAEGATTDSLDPQTYTDIYMISLGFGTHNTLTEINPEGELVGDVVESWDASDDATQWTFKLRKGIEFSNGKTMTAEDVIVSLNHHRGEDSKSAAKSNVDPIDDIKADGADTVVFTLKSANADFPFLMADYHLLIMPAVDGKADWKNYVGTGGYVLDNHEAGVRSTMKRNPNYWKADRAHFDEVELLVIADVAARQNGVVTDEVDVISRCDLKTVHLLKRRPGVRVEEETGFLHYTAPMNTTVAPFDNNDVRLALKHAVDRQQLLDRILKGHGTLGNDHPIAPSVPFHAELEQRSYDPDKAKFHLKQAGLDSLKVQISAADAAFAGAVDAAVLLREHAAPAGIEIDVAREPNDGYWSNVWMKKPWCMCYWGGRPTQDWMFSQAYAEGANWNDTYWSHERFNMLLKAGRGELDAAKRSEIYREMQQIVRDEGGVVVWAFANYVYAMRDKVQHGPKVAANWELDGGRYVERWWMS
ncbi:MAG: ABC transporter substrate-binding protein [Kiloniellales bacterium]|nr:ABC transporter substrate-binding protein [Kiloniellales bacterium]